MLRDRGEAHVERFGELGDGPVPAGEPGENSPSRGVGEGGERAAESVGGHGAVRNEQIVFNHMVK